MKENREVVIITIVIGLIIIFSPLIWSDDELEELLKFQPRAELGYLIPGPESQYLFKENLHIHADFTINADRTLASEAGYVQELFQELAGYTYPLVLPQNNTMNIGQGRGEDPAILLRVKNPDGKKNPEWYELAINQDGIRITGASGAGVMRGIQILRQILYQEILLKNGEFDMIPFLKLSGNPQFEHRGMLLDCCRHFFDKEVVKKYIDLLAYYQMNTFHWHLTEDQGWRIEIDKYPELTNVGAWRQDSTGTYGGFYTKDDIREIVAYAGERYITIIPEIELPGHSQAAIAAYPQLSCTGNPVPVANDWGVFKEIYCAGNDSVFTFLKDVLTEVMELFPGEYIHIGGDEAPKTRWEQCSKCQQRIAANGLKDEHELQSWFIKEVEQFLVENGKTLIGWDEILEGGLAETAIVQSWRGMEGGIEAAKHGNRVVMSPTSHCYFDYGLESINMEEVYSFNPIPEALPEELQEFIIGGECNMWTEHVPDEANLDSKVFPRLLAMSEVLWSNPQERDYQEFQSRVQAQYPVLKKMGVNFGLEQVAVEFVPKIIEGELWVNINATMPGIEIYTVDWPDNIGGVPNAESMDSIEIGVITNLWSQAYRDGESVGEPYNFKASSHHALGKRYKVNAAYNEWYTAGGDTALTDGVLGTIDFRDGHWQGYWGEDFTVSIDFGEVQDINSVYANFYQYNNAWIRAPQDVRIFYSEDGRHWTDLWKNTNMGDETQSGKFIQTIGWAVQETVKAQYIKMEISNPGSMPDWHEAAGEPSWVFIDEVIIQ